MQNCRIFNCLGRLIAATVTDEQATASFPLIFRCFIYLDDFSQAQNNKRFNRIIGESDGKIAFESSTQTQRKNNAIIKFRQQTNTGSGFYNVQFIYSCCCWTQFSVSCFIASHFGFYLHQLFIFIFILICFFFVYLGGCLNKKVNKSTRMHARCPATEMHLWSE